MIAKSLRKHAKNTDATECLVNALVHLTDSSADWSQSIRQCIGTPEIIEAVVFAVEKNMKNIKVVELFGFLVLKCLTESFQMSVRYAIRKSNLIGVLLTCIELHRGTKVIKSLDINANAILFLAILHDDIDSHFMSDVYESLLTSYRGEVIDDIISADVCMALLLMAKDSFAICDYLIENKVLSNLMHFILNARLVVVSLPAVLVVVISNCSPENFQLVYVDVEKCLVLCIDKILLGQTEHALIALIALYDRCTFEQEVFTLDLRPHYSFVLSHEHISFLSCQIIEKKLNMCRSTYDLVAFLADVIRGYPETDRFV